MSEHLTTEQVAEVLACSTDSVLRAITRGDLPAVKYGRLVRVSRRDLDAFLAAHRTTPARRLASRLSSAS